MQSNHKSFKTLYIHLDADDNITLLFEKKALTSSHEILLKRTKTKLRTLSEDRRYLDYTPFEACHLLTPPR